MLTTLSLTKLACLLHSFSCCCVRNLRNPAKFTENSNLLSSRSSKVIDRGVNGKPMYDFLLVTIIVTLALSATVFEILALKAGKSLNFHTYSSLTPPSGGTPLDIDVIYTPLKSAFNGLQFRRWHYRSIFVRLAEVASKVAKSRKIPTKFDVTAVQGHRSWCQSKAHVRLPISHYNSNFGPICYRFRDIDT